MTMQIDAARDRALAFLALFADGCARAEIAGSVRRGKADGIKDIEFVIEPSYRTVPNLFGEPVAEASLLDERLGALTLAGAIALDTATKRNGPKYKRYVRADEPGGVVYELWIVAPENWGNILAIRTGDAAFSHALVTSRLAGGLMPTGMQQHGGYLWRGGQVVPCKHEEDFFAALGIARDDIPEPHERTGERARWLASGKTVAR